MFGQPSTSPFAAPAGTAAPGASPFGGGGGGFGSAPTPAPFGSSAPAPAAGGFGGFGAPAPAPAGGGFGGFGAPAPAPAGGGFGGFGPPPAPAGGATAPGFGAPATSATPFGSPAPAPGGFGGFGSAPAPAPGGLFGGGAGGGFGGAAPPAGGFGSAAPSTGGFGSTAGGFGPSPAQPGASAFGAPAPAPGGGLFGGAPAPTFGSAAQPASTFGAPAPAPGGLFGSAPAAGGGLFGGGAAGGAQKPGTLAVPYQVTSKTDGTAMINIQAITAMPSYESKSLEELRLEDYASGNKGSAGQPGAAGTPAGGFGGFGAPSPPSTFGAPPAPAFGAPAPPPSGGLFGLAPAPAIFAPAFVTAPGPAPLFGSPAPAPAPGAFSFGSPSPAPAPGATGFGFGAAAPKPAGGGLFGSAPAPAPGGLFGSSPAPAPGGLFGSAPAPAPGLFGSTPAPAPGGLFGSTGAPAPAPGGLFGSTPAPAPGGLFGSTPAPAPGGLFGSTPAPAPGGSLFGAPAPAPGGLFGAPAPAPGGGLFGAPAPAPGGGLFGAPAPRPAPGGLFGAPAPAPGGLFGAPAPAAGGSIFGAPAMAPVAPLGMAPLGAPFSAAAAPPPTADAVLAQQLAAVEKQKKELELLEAWRGGTPSGSGVIPASMSEREAAAQASSYGYGASSAGAGRVASYAASSASLVSYQGAPRTAAKIRPRGFGPVKSPPTSTTSAGLLGRGGTHGSPLLSPDAYLGSSVKRLVIKPGSLTPKPKMRLLLANGDSERGKNLADDLGDQEAEEAAPDDMINRIARGTSPAATTPTVAEERASVAGVATGPPAYASPEPVPMPRRENGPAAASPGVITATTDEQTPQSSAKKTSSPGGGLAYDLYRRVIGGPEETNGDLPSPQMNGGKTSPKPYLPKLTKKGYAVSPSLDAMAALSEADLAAVSGFSVERDGYGSVAWDGAVDVRGIDLDSVICIESKDVAVYDAEEANGTKPPIGSKLNRPAVITMFGIYPKEGADASAEARKKFERKIEKTTKKMGAELITYEGSSGTWKFRVKHFSRYGLLDEDSEEEEDDLEEDAEEFVAVADSTGQDFEQGGRGGRSPDVEGQATKGKPARQSRMRAPSGGDEEMSEPTLIKDHDAQVLEAADSAYAMMVETAMIKPTVGESEKETITDDMDTDRKATFICEGEDVSSYVVDKPAPPKVEDFARAKQAGISDRLAKKCGVDSVTSSSTDFGLRMEKSFRVGWRPDGSFVFPGQFQSSTSGVQSVQLVQRRVVLDEGTSLSKDMGVRTSLLETHLKHSEKIITADDGCPVYSLPKSLSLEEGTSSSYKSLCLSLDDFAEAAKVPSPRNSVDPEVANISARAFSLLSLLFGQEDADFDSCTDVPSIDLVLANKRRREKLLLWLRQAVAYDTQKEIKRAEDCGDRPAAIFAAFSGCDLSRASSLCESGFLRLATLLSSVGQQSQTELRQQMRDWHESGATRSIPPSLLRVYSLLSGDEGVEENLYRSGGGVSTMLDWRRRLALRIWCGDKVDTLSGLIEQFESDVGRGVVPPPHPRHVTHSDSSPTEGVHCLLYNLFHLGNTGKADAEDSGILSLSSIITPLSHTPSVHDYSVSFHLAGAISAVGCSEGLTPMEEARVLDGYVCQLIQAGFWEWAVYVCLCTTKVVSNGQHRDHLWRRRAMDIVARNCAGKIDGQRSFLEAKVGIPPQWFDEALATRSAYISDFTSQANYTTQFNPEEAMKMCEDLWLPLLLFKGGTKELMQSIEASRNADDSGSKYLNEQGIIFRFLQLSREVLSLSQPSLDISLQSDRIEDLRLLACELKDIAENDELFGASNCRMRNGNIDIPRPVCIAELLSCLALLEMQLTALREGEPIFEDTKTPGGRRLKLASELVYACSSDGIVDTNYSVEMLGAQDIQRGHFGVP